MIRFFGTHEEYDKIVPCNGRPESRIRGKRYSLFAVSKLSVESTSIQR